MASNRAMQRSRKKKVYACIQANRFREAQSLLEQLCRTDSRDAEAHYLYGAVSGQLGDIDKAIRGCRTAATLKPDFVDAWYNLAQAYMHCNRPREAAEAYRRVIALQPDHVEAQFNLGYAMERLGDYGAAISCYKKAIDMKPDYVDAYCNLGNLLNNISQGARSEGIGYLKVALKIAPDFLQGWLYLGRAQHQAGDIDAALDSFDRALELRPGNTEAIGAKALAFEKRGDFAQSMALLQPLLEQADMYVAGAFAEVANHVDRANDAIALLDRVLDSGRLSDSDARALHFKQGKLLDKQRRYDEAFRHFERGNALKRSDYDADKALAQFDDIQSFFTGCPPDTLPRSSCRSRTPVFIVGMPRSGTTLVEQILDSHPHAYGAGELVYVEDTDIALNAGVRGGGYPGYLDKVTAQALDRAAAAHLEKLEALAPAGARRIVDKMPHNFRYLGLIQQVFPQARVIHCSRHPMDTCLSIYTYDFNAMHAYSTDLAWLGQYYAKYLELMAFWKRTLQIPILDVRYEDMVADQEGMTRRLIDFCELEWDDDCLSFFRNRRSVNTISYDQVRQPIYNKSVERWRNYARHLEPLRAVLGIDE